MFVIKRLFIKSLNSCVRLYSFSAKNHYDVLKLRRNCTDKEIKDAFIKMSKEYHPDKNKDAKAQEHFVRIVEAYNVLSKASSRAQYDIVNRAVSNTYVYRPHVPYKQSFKIHRDTVNERSKLLSEELNRVRNAAEENGNELQTRLLLEKIVNAANPTVATASLGQALAAEKKESPLEASLTEYGVSQAKQELDNFPLRSNMKRCPCGVTFEHWFE